MRCPHTQEMHPDFVRLSYQCEGFHFVHMTCAGESLPDAHSLEHTHFRHGVENAKACCFPPQQFSLAGAKSLNERP